MPDDKLYNLAEKIYFHELGRVEHIRNRQQLPMAVLMVFISIYVFFTNKVTLALSDDKHKIFCILLFLSLICFFGALFYFIKVFKYKNIKHMPTAKAISDYRDELEKKSLEPEADWNAEDVFNDWMVKRFNENSSKNFVTNLENSKSLEKCNLFIIMNVFIIVILCFLYTFGSLDKKDSRNDLKIHFIGSNRVNLSYNEKSSGFIIEVDSLNRGITVKEDNDAKN
ncbi:hypothetical protein [Seleniivibrio woodruffii]|uniref:Uncharacterized protein n=1 Tax=Seleniivibrio woodruffii TaxID=1078050 RepID=A0A4R1K3B1_9BACT|nr:hypothetical protein [Seleniivibrio woodruffii]TCK58380.1 hypothetical protein C8D98_2581 [Seleniivibrio woodruffii]TVZ36753.1 hypothetical protein OF66_2390 [Seleniivibrio woodruffii]